MKVCQVLFTLTLGGAEVLAARLARRLSERFEMMFVCLESLGPLGDQLIDEGYEVHVLGRQPGIDWRCARRLAALLRQERVDLVHAHQYGPFFYSGLARHFGARTPIVFTEHGRDFPDNTSKTHHFANRVLLRRRDRVIGVGSDVRRVLIEKEGFPPHRVGVVSNGIDLSAYTDVDADRTSIRRELGLGEDDFVIIQVARVVPIKDHATAIRAFEVVCRSQPKARLVIVGDGSETEAIEAMVRERGLEAQVRMLGRRHDVPRLLKGADLGLLTSVSEGIPLSIIESMAAGLPVVATRVGGVSEVVVEGQTGFLAPAGAHEALADHVRRLSEDPELRQQLGEGGRERAWAVFSEDRMVTGYDEIYREVAGRRRPGGQRTPLATAARGV